MPGEFTPGPPDENEGAENPEEAVLRAAHEAAFEGSYDPDRVTPPGDVLPVELQVDEAMRASGPAAVRGAIEDRRPEIDAALRAVAAAADKKFGKDTDAAKEAARNKAQLQLKKGQMGALGTNRPAGGFASGLDRVRRLIRRADQPAETPPPEEPPATPEDPETPEK